MKQWYRDTGLQARMFLTMFLLAAVYLAFIIFLATMGVGTMGIVVVAGLFIFIQYFYSDKLVLWSMGGKIVSESEEPELHTIISRLCQIADLPKPRIAVVENNVPNAFATGRSKKNAVVAVTTGLMHQLNHGELEAVIAHELSHVKNRDVLVITIASFISTIAFFLARNLMFFGMMGRGRRDSGGIMAVWIVSLLVWLISFLLIRALSRYREFSADRGSAAITGQPAQLASALMKISGAMKRVPTDDLRKVEGMNAFFIIPAVSGSSLMKLFSTHPQIEQRIAKLEEMQQKMEF
ncbi:MAG: heat shock protein HtpX [Candidatus Argoarchaeum ethanivorans]|uniref:Protease HtpX homolog n=1 Tax=Candidatus Argoarchaeum ethanivorans TaxID=2608793 RepID=A0A8B3S3I6_9EURY|nr:MAG: heat shock protein HtpX [Candidatus Argoarchaeum ethanivorans]